MKLGVICDGISRDLVHAVDVMDEFDLTYAELQFVGDTEVGDHSREDIRRMDERLRDRGWVEIVAGEDPVGWILRSPFEGEDRAVEVEGDKIAGEVGEGVDPGDHGVDGPTRLGILRVDHVDDVGGFSVVGRVDRGAAPLFV